MINDTLIREIKTYLDLFEFKKFGRFNYQDRNYIIDEYSNNYELDTNKRYTDTYENGDLYQGKCYTLTYGFIIGSNPNNTVEINVKTYECNVQQPFVKIINLVTINIIYGLTEYLLTKDYKEKNRRLHHLCTCSIEDLEEFRLILNIVLRMYINK